MDFTCTLTKKKKKGGKNPLRWVFYTSKMFVFMAIYILLLNTTTTINKKDHESAKLFKFQINCFKNNRHHFKCISKLNFMDENGQPTKQLMCIFCEWNLSISNAVRQLCL